MVEADIGDIDVVAGYLLEVVEHINGHVAKADALDVGVIEHELGDDARGIGEVDEPCVGADSLYPVADMLNNGDGALSLKEAADTGGLLTDKVIFPRDALVEVAAGQLADSYLSDNEIGAPKRGIEIVGKDDLAVAVCVLEHTHAEIANDSPLALVDIHKCNLLELEAVARLEEAVDKLGAIGAAGADNRNIDFFHIILTPLY